jgi:hypothetical protein
MSQVPERTRTEHQKSNPTFQALLLSFSTMGDFSFALVLAQSEDSLIRAVILQADIADINIRKS